MVKSITMESEYVNYIKPDEVADLPLPPLPENPAIKFKFQPDPWQRFAIHAIELGHNLLVTAKTSAGKTTAAEYQIAKSLQRGKRVFYTTPIKSLSNQKFNDLKELFPEASVGIMTGDIKYRPDAQIIVMTTEILRNLLFKQGTMTEKVGTTSLLSLEGLDAVIFDEVHYINDKDRGHVWEETLMLLPSEVHLILLSATLANPYPFAKWLGINKQKKIWLISTMWRAVPLEHCVLNGEGKQICIYNSKEQFHQEHYRAWLQARKDGLLAYDKFKEKVKDARRSEFEGPVAGKTRPKAFEHQLNDCLNKLHEQENLPAIVFQFSRVGCETLASKVNGNFIDSSDSTVVKHIWNFHLSRYNASLEKSPQYHKLFELVQKGVAFHHSGLLPFLKEVLEILFAKGYIKVLFATETFSVGINMPTKTVLFTNLEKYTDGGQRVLTTAEYVQMAGRAGRRGKDVKGLVLYLPQRDPLDLSEIRSMMTGQAQSFSSRLDFHYDFLLKLLNSGQIEKRVEVMKKSYWWVLEEDGRMSLEKEYKSHQKKLMELEKTFSPAQVLVCQDKEDIDKRIATSQNAKKKQAQRDLSLWESLNKKTVWEPVLQRWASFQALKAQTLQLEKTLEVSLERGKDIPQILTRLSLLEEFEYVKADGTLSMYGQMASEVNEGHPFLMTELYKRIAESLKLNSIELLCVLALFLGEDREKNTGDKHPLDLNVSKGVQEELLRIGDDLDRGLAVERKLGLVPDPDFWSISTEWIEPVHIWITNPESTLASIAEEYEVFEGNVQKALMKLASLVEEFQSLATLGGSVELLRMLEDARSLVLRDLVVAESLYLRI